MTNKHYIAIDTETGGLDPKRCALLSIACVSSRGPTFERLIYPPVGDVDARAAEVNGYTAEGWIERGAAPLNEVMNQLMNWVFETAWADPEVQAEMVAHNAPFDQGFVRENMIRAGLRTRSKPWTCTKERLRKYLGKGYYEPGCKLDDLGRLSGYWDLHPRSEAHDALEDAKCCLHGMIWLDRENEQLNNFV